MTNVEEDVVTIVANVAKVDRATVARDSNLQEMGLESLDVVEIVFAIEDKFDVTVAYNANQAGVVGGSAFRTIGDVIDAVMKLVADRSVGELARAVAQPAA